MKLAEELGGSKLTLNTAAVASAVGILELDLSYPESVTRVISDGEKDLEIAERNTRIANAAYEGARERYAPLFEQKLGAMLNAPKRVVINGNQALGSGLSLQDVNSVWLPNAPLPASLEFMFARSRKFGIVIRQTEDEISALLHVIGAAHAGVRATTCTSDGRFSFMAEASNFAGSTETPAIATVVQRLGPATVMPTRMEQGELLFTIFVGHGEFLKAIIALSSVEQCIYELARAFNIAGKYQMPIIILADAFSANSLRSVDLNAVDFPNHRKRRSGQIDFAPRT